MEVTEILSIIQRQLVEFPITPNFIPSLPKEKTTTHSLPNGFFVCLLLPCQKTPVFFPKTQPIFLKTFFALSCLFSLPQLKCFYLYRMSTACKFFHLSLSNRFCYCSFTSLRNTYWLLLQLTHFSLKSPAMTFTVQGTEQQN